MSILRRAAAVTLLSCLTVATAQAELKVGIFPRGPVKDTHQAFKPLAAHLTQALGEEATLVVPKDFAAFWEGVSRREYDLVHLNQFHYIKGHDEFGYRVVLANEEGGQRTMRGVLLARKDSGIDKVADLKGKTVLFAGDKMAMASYIAPTALLHRQGLNAGTDYQEQFAKNPPAAAIGMYNKAGDAAGVGDAVLRMPAVTTAMDTAQVKVLAESEPIITLPWAVKGDLPADKVEKIQKSLSALPKGHEVLEAARVTGFFPATDADFAKVRELAAAAGVVN